MSDNEFAESLCQIMSLRSHYLCVIILYNESYIKSFITSSDDGDSRYWRECSPVHSLRVEMESFLILFSTTTLLLVTLQSYIKSFTTGDSGFFFFFLPCTTYLFVFDNIKPYIQGDITIGTAIWGCLLGRTLRELLFASEILFLESAFPSI